MKSFIFLVKYLNSFINFCLFRKQINFFPPSISLTIINLRASKKVILGAGTVLDTNYQKTNPKLINHISEYIISRY